MSEKGGRAPITDASVGPIEIFASDGHVILRQFTSEDSGEIFELIDKNREHLSQNGDDTSHKYPTRRSVRESIENPKNPKRLRFTIRSLEGIYVGSINLTPEENDPKAGEIGYYLGAKYTGKGIATSAVETLADFAFNNLGYEVLFGKVAITNSSSLNVLLKAGFSEEKQQDGQRYLYRRKPVSPSA